MRRRASRPSVSAGQERRADPVEVARRPARREVVAAPDRGDVVGQRLAREPALDALELALDARVVGHEDEALVELSGAVDAAVVAEPAAQDPPALALGRARV